MVGAQVKRTSSRGSARTLAPSPRLPKLRALQGVRREPARRSERLDVVLHRATGQIPDLAGKPSLDHHELVADVCQHDQRPHPVAGPTDDRRPVTDHCEKTAHALVNGFDLPLVGGALDLRPATRPRVRRRCRPVTLPVQDLTPMPQPSQRPTVVFPLRPPHHVRHSELATMARATSTSTTWSTRPPMPAAVSVRSRSSCSPRSQTSNNRNPIPSMSTVLSTPARTECSAQNSASTSPGPVRDEHEQ